MGVVGDVHYYGGGALLAIGAGLRWDAAAGLMVAGAVLVAAVLPILWRRRGPA